MDSEQIKVFKDEITEHLEMVVQKVVNGKIDKLALVVEHLKHNVDQMDLKNDAFIVRAKPVVDFFEHITWTKKFIIGTVTTLSILAGAMASFWALKDKILR